LAFKYGAFLYLDEAHALGILGTNGYGLSTTVDLTQVPHLIMGTFSKAIGVCGAYIACSKDVKNYLINRCSGFIYSTSLSPMIVGVSYISWLTVKTLNVERDNLISKANNLRKILQNLGFDTATSSTHIIPIILKTEKNVIDACEKLKKDNIIVSSIRPPTIPPGSSRLRIALTTSHSEENIEQLVNSLRDL
jgi:8-amino-7-oxononanoate synthase